MLNLSVGHVGAMLRVGAVAGLALTVSACSLAQKDDPSGGQACPQVRIDRDTAKMTVFRDGPGRDLTDVVYTVEIADYTGDCTFVKDKEKGTTINMRMKVLFAISKGPAETAPDNKMDYFVAIPAFYPATSAKQVMPVQFKYPQTNVVTMMVRDEEVRLTLPLKDMKTKDMPVYIGFQLTPDQLAYNRRQNSR